MTDTFDAFKAGWDAHMATDPEFDTMGFAPKTAAAAYAVWSGKMWIVIEDGIFEGTLEQFRNCFFSNATRKSIVEFCDRQGWAVEIYGNE